jgi:hypothetical protein
MLETNDFEGCRDKDLLMHIHSDETRINGEIWGESGGYHARDEFYLRWFIGVVLVKLHDESKCSIFKRCICRTEDDCIPTQISSVTDIKSSRDSLPCHYIFAYRTCTDSCRGIRLHSLWKNRISDVHSGGDGDGIP